jgi:hypothetical protein
MVWAVAIGKLLIVNGLQNTPNHRPGTDRRQFRRAAERPVSADAAISCFNRWGDAQPIYNENDPVSLQY